MIKVRNSYPNNPIIGYPNINTLQNKTINLREIIAKTPLDVFCIDETKLNSFPNSRLLLENFQFSPFRRDRNSKRGGKSYYNYIIVGDLNINMLDPKCDRKSHLSDLKDTYNLSNLVKSSNCFKSSKDTLLDVFLTNKAKSFHKTFVCETGLCDYHKLAATICR